MLIEHRGKRPAVHETAWVAPNATLCGAVTIGSETRVMHGAVLTAEGGSIAIGSHCIVMENAVVRASARHAVTIGDHVIVGPHAHLTGCVVEPCAFVATGASVFNGAVLGARSEVRINGVVHVNSKLAPDATVPIGWVAVGDPARLFPPGAHDEIWAVQRGMDFAGTVFGTGGAPPGETIMPDVTRRYARSLARHRGDAVVDDGG